MLKTYIFCLFYAFIALELELVNGIGEECALNTECILLSRCPYIIDNFERIAFHAYCNMGQDDSFVCCPVEPLPYVQEKDETSRIVKECRGFQQHRPKCITSLIVGGKKADPKEYPFMALLFYQNGPNYKWRCGGTLISSRFVLSAAHCFDINDKPNRVRLGELDYSTTMDDAKPVDFDIKKEIIHPQYGVTNDKFNDIALVELDREATFNDYILPACLPLVDGRGFNQFVAAGWGTVGDAGDLSSHLLKVKLDQFDDATCLDRIGKRKVPIINTTIQMCAGSFQYERDTCTGDSGGPLFVDHPDYKCMSLVLGITSFSEGGCGNKNYPAFYTRISSYTDWIEKIVWG